MRLTSSQPSKTPKHEVELLVTLPWLLVLQEVLTLWPFVLPYNFKDQYAKSHKKTLEFLSESH